MGDLVSIGMIGCGGMAGAHRQGYETLWKHDIRNFEIVATCDIEESRAIKMADDVEKFQGKRPRVYSHVEDMLAKEKELRAVDISSVHRSHHTLATPCLEAGKYVTIEKPLAITMRAGKAIIDAAQKAGVVLQVAENYRRSPDERAINWALRQGRIGKLRMIYWIDVGERLWYWDWRDHKDQAGGGWSLDGGVHFADLFRYHIGDVKTLYANVQAFHPIRYKKHETMEDPVQATVEDTTIAILDFENGTVGQWTSTGAAPGHKFNHRAVHGDNGSIKWGEGLLSRTEQLTIAELREEHQRSLSEEAKEQLFPRGITDAVATELKEFIDTILGNGRIETDGVEGFKAQAICMALYESAYLEQPVEIQKIENCEIEGYQSEINESLGL